MTGEQIFFAGCASVVTMAGAVNAFILQGFRKDVQDFKSELAKKRDASYCETVRNSCIEVRKDKSKELKDGEDELWDALNCHSHTGLPNDSKVVR